MSAPILAAANIEVGVHFTRHIFGLTVNIDTVATTAAAGLIVIALGLYVRHRITNGVPGRLQLALETIVTQIENQVFGAMGDQGRPIVPLAMTLFLLILIANWIALIPSGHNPEYAPPPASDINFTAALAIFVIVLVHATWIRSKGLRNYMRHYFTPLAMTPINFIEELSKPITLALRLFGNIFAGGLLLALIAGLLPTRFILPIPLLEVVWKLFDGVIVGPLQAFIFALLTVFYFETAVSGQH